MLKTSVNVFQLFSYYFASKAQNFSQLIIFVNNKLNQR